MEVPYLQNAYMKHSTLINDYYCSQYELCPPNGKMFRRRSYFTVNGITAVQCRSTSKDNEGRHKTSKTAIDHFVTLPVCHFNSQPSPLASVSDSDSSVFSLSFVSIKRARILS